MDKKTRFVIYSVLFLIALQAVIGYPNPPIPHQSQSGAWGEIVNICGAYENDPNCIGCNEDTMCCTVPYSGWRVERHTCQGDTGIECRDSTPEVKTSGSFCINANGDQTQQIDIFNAPGYDNTVNDFIVWVGDGGEVQSCDPDAHEEMLFVDQYGNQVTPSLDQKFYIRIRSYVPYTNVIVKVRNPSGTIVSLGGPDRMGNHHKAGQKGYWDWEYTPTQTGIYYAMFYKDHNIPCADSSFTIEQQSYCGDGHVDYTESCEYPDTYNNHYCVQSTERCEGNKLGTRDYYGDCGHYCGCIFDSFNFQCVEGRCGADCDSNYDCDNTECDHLDGCVGNDYYDYSDKVNDCRNCMCEENSCSNPTVSYNDPRCTECQYDSDCNYLDDDYCTGDFVKHDEGVCINFECEVETTTEDCNQYDQEYCSNSKVWEDDGTCSNAQCSVSTSLVEQCDDGLACNGQESCEEDLDTAFCVPGEPIDCSYNDKEEISTCNNIPDDNPFSWDYRESFESECIEPGQCTTWGGIITHACDISRCNAECEKNSDCDDSNPLTDDICVECECEHIKQGYCGDGIVDPDAGEECERPNTALASCDYGSSYLGDYCDANCQLQDEHCEDDYPGCSAHPECDEVIPGTEGCDLTCQPYECMDDSDCDYLDDDYCAGDLIRHDQGVCIENKCEVETTTEDCSELDTEYCSGNSIVTELYSCDSAKCVIIDSDSYSCDDGLACNGQETCEETPGADHQAECVLGEPIDCSEYDIEEIMTCNNMPDSNPYTWDKREGFESECVEPGECTTGDEMITHSCDISRCNAECERNSDCDDSNPLTDDICTDSCTCEYTHNGYCGDGIVDPDAGEECELPNTVLASCDEHGSPYLQDYCDANCKLQDNHCEDDYAGCLSAPECDEFAPGTNGCDEMCQPYECMEDSDCDYLDDDYCDGDFVKHDQGVCIENQCETETTTEDCNELDSGYCVGTEHWGRDGTCSNAECVFSDTLKQDCDDGLGCNGQESCEEDNDSAFCVPGEPIDCSEYDIEEIMTCNNIPDSNPYTWDKREGFESECVEPGECTTEDDTLTHTCDMSRCNAECETDSDCDDSDPLTDDVCTDSCVCEYTHNGYCGDGMVDSSSEECELPDTQDNSYCEQSTEKCEGKKTATRDEFGYCDPNCGCLQDVWPVAECVQGSCGAECDSDDDCNDLNEHTIDTCSGCMCEHEYVPYCGDGNIDAGEECELPGTSGNENCFAKEEECVGNKLSVAQGYGDCSSQCMCVFGEFETKTQCVAGRCGAECATDADCFDDNPTTIDICSDCMCEYEKTECDYNYINEPKAKIRIDRIGFVYDEVVEPGEELQITVNFRNMGYCEMKNLEIEAFVQGLGIKSRRLGPMSVNADGELTRDLLLEIPDDARPGFYMVKLELYNEGLRRVRHRPIIVV